MPDARVPSEPLRQPVLRYAERNPLRAGLVERAEGWRWSSLFAWARSDRPQFLHEGPVDRGPRWVADVNRPMTAAEEDALHMSVDRGRPFGTPHWEQLTAVHLGLDSTLRPRGRPRKKGTSTTRIKSPKK